MATKKADDLAKVQALLAECGLERTAATLLDEAPQIGKKNATVQAFLKPEDVVYADERLKDNTYISKGGFENDFGYKAHMDLIVTRGKGFTKEKNKKKRGSYSGGKITMQSHSIKKLAGIGKPKQAFSSSAAALKNQPPLFLRKNCALAHLVKGSFKGVVQQPKYADLNEWLSINTFEFFNLVNMFYGVVTDFCTINECPTMSAGPGTEYTWTDTQRKTIKLAAPQYIDYVLSQIQTTLDDERMFPTKAGSEFPKDIRATLCVIYRHLFRVLAHIYWSHYVELLNLKIEGHVNSVFAHFISFAKEFDLLDRKDMAPMADLIAFYEQQGIVV
ncbi:Maintenance of ploidy protein mob2 [Coemansia spiralis]|uniref:Maintenance of ploidy protein mob2 n=1 Tax=Coemansia spiralis TaxID=417178 RepID=A0A9W8L1H7_9FUNG|nr:Maintenance of ploidy protein mob2 [Coemansia spiralis]